MISAKQDWRCSSPKAESKKGDVMSNVILPRLRHGCSNSTEPSETDIMSLFYHDIDLLFARKLLRLVTLSAVARLACFVLCEVG